MPKTRSKFNVSKDKSKRTFDNIVFDSEIEMKYYRDVILPNVESGEIIYYERQRKYELQPKFVYQDKTILPINYVADFVVRYKDGNTVVIDIKGTADATAKLKKKIFHHQFPLIDYKWICYSKVDGGWCEYDFVQKQRRLRKKNKKK